ncbi:MAG TPA: FkbM family methyltransferase [Candidatus Thermoplasmatota archaeon]|nr:FkbM family methyltransferase [Candidatus Thermoplasmatota archaeon]
MDRELAFWLALTRRLPAVKGAGALANVAKRAYARKPRPPVEADVLGFRMRLEPGEVVDRDLLIAPQFYDRHQMRFLRERLRPGDSFVDVGANVGIYALVASRLVGPAGRVLAIEADPYNQAKLDGHLRANGAANVAHARVGVSDKRETLRLQPGIHGNRGGSSFALEGDEAIEVACLPLLDVLREHRFREVHGMKMDIEGFEHRVLTPFFRDAPEAMKPRFLVVERNLHLLRKAGGDVLDLVQANGYKVAWRDEGDFVLVRNV